MQSKATTVKDFLAELPEDRRKALSKVRAVIRKHLPAGYKEGIQWGAIAYFVPHSLYPAGYHCDPAQPLPFAGLASQKNYMTLSLFCVYCDEGDQKRLVEAWRKTGKKLDMGKSCIRFKKLEDVPLEVIGDAVRRVPVKKFIQSYEAGLKAGSARRKKASAVNKTAGRRK